MPSFRPDIRGEADLVEEVCRIVGLDQVRRPPCGGLRGRPPGADAAAAATVAVRHGLPASGSMKRSPGRSSPRTRRSCSAADSPSQLDNPISSEPPMRPCSAQSDRGDVARTAASPTPACSRSAGLCRRPAEQETVQAAAAVAGRRRPPLGARAARRRCVRRQGRCAGGAAAAGAPVGNLQMAVATAVVHPGARPGAARPEIQLGWRARSIRGCCRRMFVARFMVSRSSSMRCSSRAAELLPPALEARPHAGQARFRLRGR